jgi:hypothetical protein
MGKMLIVILIRNNGGNVDYQFSGRSLCRSDWPARLLGARDIDLAGPRQSRQVGAVDDRDTRRWFQVLVSGGTSGGQETRSGHRRMTVGT